MRWRSWWLNSSLTVRRGAKGLLIAAILSGVAILIAYLAIWWLAPTAAKASATRFANFVDAVLAGVVAFAMLGAFAFVASLRRPEEDAIADRIAYLYSARLDESQSARKYLTEQVMLLGATIREAHFVYRFIEIAADGLSVKYHACITMDIVNMMKSDAYHQEMRVRIGLDPVVGHENNMGLVHRIATTPGHGSGKYHFGEPVSALDAPVQLTAANSIFETHIQLTIPPFGELRYECMYEAWVNAQDTFWVGANRYADAISIRLENLTPKHISVVPNPAPKRSVFHNIERSYELDANEHTDLTVVRDLPPTKSVTFSIRVA